MLNKLYQTLEDKSNIDYVEQNGPFYCNKNKAWLGEGFYFWDTFIEYAHWWGKVAYEYYHKDYIICLSEINLKSVNIYDLTQPEILYEFREIEEALKSRYTGKIITVPVIIEYMKRHIAHFNEYKAIRASVNEATNYDKEIYSKRTPFVIGNRAYLNTCPQVQLCILDKSIIGSENFRFIYPTIYAKEYVI